MIMPCMVGHSWRSSSQMHCTGIITTCLWPRHNNYCTQVLHIPPLPMFPVHYHCHALAVTITSTAIVTSNKTSRHLCKTSTSDIDTTVAKVCYNNCHQPLPDYASSVSVSSFLVLLSLLHTASTATAAAACYYLLQYSCFLCCY
jgi:hypothetical protein